MRKSTLLCAGLLYAGVALGDAPLDVTIRVLESPHELPDAVTRTIELPPRAADAAREHAQPGLDRANDARASEPRQNGLDRARDARPQGRDLPPRGAELAPRGPDLAPSVPNGAGNPGRRGGGPPAGRGRP